MENNVYKINQRHNSKLISQNQKMNLLLEDEFISLINSLSSSLKEYYLNITKIIKDLRNTSLELNKYILTSKCLINEMTNKANIQERLNQFNKNIESINLSNKNINSNISLFEANLSKLFDNSKIIFKKMKEFQKKKINKIMTNHPNYSYNNKNKNLIDQNSIRKYNNKIKGLKLSLDTNKINSFSHMNKSYTNHANRKIEYSNKEESDNILNKSKCKNNKKYFNNNLSDINFLEKRIKNKIDNNKIMNKKSNSSSNIKRSKNIKIVKIPSVNLSKFKYIFEFSPIKKEISNYNEKKNLIYYNYNNFNPYQIKNKYPSSGNSTSRMNNYNYSNRKSQEQRLNYDSSFYENFGNNNIIDLLENIIEYFYSLNQYQNCIINKCYNINDKNNISYNLKNSLKKINELLFINNDILINKNLKQKLFYLLNQNKNLNQKLILLISRLNNKNNINNSYNEKICFEYKNKKGSTFEANEQSFNKNIIFDCNKTIEKLKNENKNLNIFNKKILNKNKLLNQKLNIKELGKNINIQNEYNKNLDLNLTINRLTKDNKKHLFQIKNLKKDNEELLKLIKNKNINNKEDISNNINNQSSNDLINDNMNNIIIQKDNEIKKLQLLLEENILVNNELKEKEKEKEIIIKKLNEEISSYNNKYNIEINLINEKNDIINELNINITNLKKEIENNKNKYNNDIINLKNEMEKNNKIKENEINELKKIIHENNSTISNINKDKSNIENELINLKKELIKKSENIYKLSEENNKLIEMNKSKDIKSEDNINIIKDQKENEIKILKEKISEFENKNIYNENEKNNFLKKIEDQSKEINQLNSIINSLNEKIKIKEKNVMNKNNKKDKKQENKDSTEDDKIDIHDIENQIINYMSDADNDNDDEKIGNHENENSIHSIEMSNDNEKENENQSKRLSTPSFKSPELEENDNVGKNDDNINELKKLNELLLDKVKEYENTLKINQESETEEEHNKNNLNNTNNINEDNPELKFYQNKYIKYLNLYNDIKKKCEFYETSNEIIKNDALKSKNEIKELTKKLKENNIETDKNYVATLSSLKLNYQYNPNEYIILCDKTYNQFKWFLMKKKYNEFENEEMDNYNNLIWVPKIDISDLEGFNNYVNEEENNSKEMLNLIKKLEEKENIISKLSYKLEKIEKDIENKSTNNYINNINDINIKNKNNKFRKNSSDEYRYNNYDDGFSSRKFSSKDKSNKYEQTIPIEKYNILLSKLSETEQLLEKIQKEYENLKKNQKFLNERSRINTSSDINKANSMGNNMNMINHERGLGLIDNNNNGNNEGNENLNNNIINSNISFKSEEIEYYKNKYNELEIKLRILKDSCKKILTRLTIPKKEKGEIKQILKLFDYTEDEILIILGEKKK